jgi:hypothetical protein
MSSFKTSTDADKCVFIGHSAGKDGNVSGDGTIGIGASALLNLTSGTGNVAIGYQSADALTVGQRNVVVGHEAMSAAIEDGGCVAIGWNTLKIMNAGGSDGSNTSHYTTAVGYNNGSAITDGVNNTMLGGAAGVAITTGDNNTCVGTFAEVSSGGATAQIAIGRGVVCTGDNTVTIGIGANTGSLGLDGSDTSWAAASSDERLKENITTSTAGLSFVNDLRPVTYNWKKAGEIPEDMPQYVEDSEDPCLGYEYGETLHGFIAQEVKTVIDNHSELKKGFKMWKEYDSGVQTVADGNLIPMLVKAIQELTAKVEALENA